MENLFFSESLIHKLEVMRSSSLTAVEAPAGYGKTTAVRKALESVDPDLVCWYTAVESVQDSSFRWFIRQLESADEASASRLRELGYLNRSNASAAAEILDRMTVSEPLYIVIDNFQYIMQNWQPQIISALSGRRRDGLHVILVSQNFGRLRGVLSCLEQRICCITFRDLLLLKEDIRSFARQTGISVTAEQAQSIHSRTEGWAVAVSLYLENLRQNESGGNLPDNIDGLLYKLFWERLTEKQRKPLLRLSVFDKVHGSLAKKILEEERFDDERLSDLFSRVPLIGYDAGKREYLPHEILRSFLRRQLQAADPAFRRDVYRNAGACHRDSGWTKEAVNCFYKARDYEGILSCELAGLLTETFDGASCTDIARTVLRECPQTVQAAYPLSVLRLCYALYAGTAFREFEQYLEQARGMIEQSGSAHMMGEWMLVSAFLDFPDIEKMAEKYRKAEDLLTGPSRVFTYQEPFLFGCTSMWYLFYTTPGEMMRTADKLAEAMKVYNRLTNGHGAGAAELYRGEALSVQGRFEESEIQAYQAAFLSEQSRSAGVTYGAALLFGINAIYRSDMAALQQAIGYLENKAQAYPFLQGKAINTHMVETVRGYLLGLMMETGRSAVWTQGDADKLSDLTFTNFMIKTCRITDLILRKKYKRAIASVEASLQMDKRLISLPTQNFMCVGLALCYLAIGRLLKAAEYLDKSLTLAGRDKNYTFIACFQKYFSVLFLMPSIAGKHGDTIREIKALDIRYTRAEESRIFSMLEEATEYAGELTRREREIAELAAKGMRNSEIAKALHLSENTVKFHLKTVFQKMNIDRRSRLVELLK